MKLIQTKLWYEDPSLLYNLDYLTEIFPFKRFDIMRKLNALVRLSILYAIIMYIYKRDQLYLCIPIVIMGISLLIWYNQSNVQTDKVMKQAYNDSLEQLVQLNDLETECRIPKKDNPFMNPTLKDYGNNLNPTPKSCPSYNNKGVQRRVEELFNEDLYRDVTDVFGKNNSQRQFYTVPGNQVPNDQGSFAQWCYGTPKTCKEGNQVACLSANGRSSSAPSH